MRARGNPLTPTQSPNRPRPPAPAPTPTQRTPLPSSFDVNKPGSEVDELKGGVAGGSILQGVLKMGQEVEVRPGIIAKDSEGKVTCTPIRSRIVSLFAGEFSGGGRWRALPLAGKAVFGCGWPACAAHALPSPPTHPHPTPTAHPSHPSHNNNNTKQPTHDNNNNNNGQSRTSCSTRCRAA